MDKKLKVGLIGLGGIMTNSHMREYEKAEDLEIVEVHKRVNVILLLESFIKGTNDFFKKYGDDSEEYGIMKITII